MQKKPKILVVDDKLANIRLLEANLQLQDYEILTALNGKEALEIVANDNIDLILLDVMMPGIDGFEVTRRLKANEDTCFIPIVLITALKESQDRIKGIEAGCDDFLSKPVNRLELKVRITSLLKVKESNDYIRNYEKKLEEEISRRTNQLHEALKKVEEASLETIYRLSKAAEYRDDDTGAHIQRMSHYAAAVAKSMSADEDTVKSILYAAPMHDVGKIAIPDSILLKPGKLTADEWDIMKQHAVLGAHILKDSETEFIRLGEIIALTHHEKWDGSGYPDGMKGIEIPICGRIVAIADVFDALTSRRPYKEPFSVEKSFQCIEEGRGSHFDPEVTDAFFAIKDKLLEIKSKFVDPETNKMFKIRKHSL